MLRLGYTGRTFGYKCSLHEGVIEKRHARSISTQFKVPDWQERPNQYPFRCPLGAFLPLLSPVRRSFFLSTLATNERQPYAGARCDVESMQYSYSFADDIQEEWTWSEL